tara:strand:+ start:148 stop:1068 length:921 start_codon:yes stop_codon:yes gene_type:complete
LKILIISSNLIGDNILSSGAIKHYIENYPNCNFTFITGPTAYQLYEHFPNLRKRIKIRKKKYNFHWFKIFIYCLFIKWDVIIDFRSSIISYLLIHKKKYIFKKNTDLHHLDQLTNLFKYNCNSLKVFTNTIEDQEANEKLDNKFKYIVISPGGNWMPKIWPVEKYNEIIRVINKEFDNIKFILVGSSKEKEIYFDNVIKGIDQSLIIDLMGAKLTLTSAYMKKSNLFLGNDSGMMHLSVASKLNTIGLFGPTNDKIYSPKGKNCFVVRTKEEYSYLRKSIDNFKISYMNSINIDDVMKVIRLNKLL